DEVSLRYGLGLSLGYDQLQGYMRRKGYTPENLRDCGLVNGDQMWDAFAGRIIVPICNAMNEVIAFGGRIYHGEKDTAKYKNSTNTLLFDKSRTIYGVNYVKKEKKENGGFKELILVEGYMDVISLGAAGIRNAVAGMGTALTAGQAQELKRLVPSIYVCYDGDNAGRTAAIRNIDTLASVGLDVRVVSLEDGLDPDDTVKKEGYEGFMARLKAALPVVDYKLKLCADACDLGSVNGRAKYVTAACDVLKTIDSPAEREVYLTVVAEKSGISVEALSEDINKDVRGGASTEATRTEKEAKSLLASRFVLNRILNNADYTDVDQVKSDWLPHPTHQMIFEFAQSCKRQGIVIGDM
ncbi:MAG: toprim domain-containing protein, partial [Clostridia bacterium]